MFADFISRNKALTFTQDDATEYRKRIASLILNGNKRAPKTKFIEIRSSSDLESKHSSKKEKLSNKGTRVRLDISKVRKAHIHAPN